MKKEFKKEKDKRKSTEKKKAESKRYLKKPFLIFFTGFTNKLIVCPPTPLLGLYYIIPFFSYSALINQQIQKSTHFFSISTKSPLKVRHLLKYLLFYL